VFYARARAADPRELGPWSAPTSFSVAADAQTIGVGGGSAFDRVAAPTGEAALEPTPPSCQSAGPGGEAAGALALVALLGARARRRRYSDAQR
jgi:MYXO-CTERM domain-containing protein